MMVFYCEFCQAELNNAVNNSKKIKKFFGSKNGKSFICNFCVQIAFQKCLDQNIFEEKEEDFTIIDSDKISNEELFSYKDEIKTLLYQLDKSIIGNDLAKKEILALLSYHQWRIFQDDPRIPKKNAIIMGTTGTGKTSILKILSKEMGIPIVIADSTTLTKTGYVGDDVSTILNILLEEAGNDIFKAQKGVIVFDEFDKIISHKNDSLSSRSVSDPLSLQSEFLKFIESKQIYLSPSSEQQNVFQQIQTKKVVFDTSDLTFIMLGSFEHLRKQILNKKNLSILKMHRNSNNEDSLLINENIDNLVSITKGLIEIGMVRELAARFTSFIFLKDLNVEQYKNIILYSDLSPLSNIRKYFKYFKSDIIISDEAITLISETAFKEKMGVRYLNTIFNRLLEPIVAEYILQDKFPDVSIELNEQSKIVILFHE